MTGADNKAGLWRSALWALVAIIALSSALIVNGRPLFYFDTFGYVDQGNTALRQLGFETQAVQVNTTLAANGKADPSRLSAHTVDGSRSPSYSVLAGLLSAFGFLEGLLVWNAAALLAALWILARVLQRTYLPDAPRARLVSLPIILASFGALPFFAAYLMPDLLGPVMILCIATLTAFGRQMTRAELLVCILIASIAVTAHLSHFAIALLLTVAALFVAAVLSRARLWVVGLCLLVVLAAGYGQQMSFRLLAAKTGGGEVVLKPYITARLIQDGPGFEWLKAHCPDTAVPTCALWQALQLSDDPYRLTASHITFETSARLGSFRLMNENDQKAVAQGQVGFFLDVLSDMPVAVMGAFLKNTLIQAAMVNIDMTLPTAQIVAQNAKVEGALSGTLVQGRLAHGAPWGPGLLRLHGALYAGCLATTAYLLLFTRSMPAPVRAFATMVLLGILANALVCGGISQPATRYGARMIWLLPLLTAVLMMLAARPIKEGER